VSELYLERLERPVAAAHGGWPVTGTPPPDAKPIGMAWRCRSACCRAPCAAGGWIWNRTGRSFTIPLVNIVPARDGLMAGEPLFDDAATFCDQARLGVRELRAAAAAT
jgi:hypothetical protein